MVAVFGPLLLVEGSVYIWDASVSGGEPETPAADEQQPCRLKLARGLLLAESRRLVVAVANAGTLHGRPEVACGRRDGPDRCRAVLARWPGAKRQARAPLRRAAYAVFCLHGPVFCLPVGQKRSKQPLIAQAAAFEHIIRRLDRKQQCAFCRSFRADARTRTEDPFITSYGLLSPGVSRSHLRSLRAPGLHDRR
jgi:hypothetical protein